MFPLNVIRERGLMFVLGVLYCRVVPAWVLRARRFVVFELQSPGAGQSAPNMSGVKPRILRCTSAQDRCDLATRCKTGAAIDSTADGWAVVIDEKVIGGVWIARERFVEQDLKLTIVLRDDARWLFSAFVHPDYRRLGVYAWMIDQLLSQHYASTRVTAAISVFNRASMAAHKKMIRKKLATVSALRFLGFSFAFSRPATIAEGLVVFRAGSAE